MSKKNKPTAPKKAAPVVKKQAAPIAANKSSFTDFNSQAILLAIICFIFYANTFSNNYALDDELVITNNEYVQKGMEGIPQILNTDAYESYAKQLNSKNTLSGGRYRPLSLLTFAIEQQLFGQPATDIQTATTKQKIVDTHLAHTQHVVNVLLYIIAIILLLYFLRTIVFPNQPIIALLAALIFAIHPIHTEVVANIKSRDEILSLLFIFTTFIYVWKYKASSDRKHLIISLCAIFLALLSKEYALTLIVLIPLMFYLFKKDTATASLKATIPYLAVCILYLIIRFSIVPLNAAGDNTELMNNPYLLATGTQKLATIIATQFNYIRLLFWPSPLTSDYSYNQIPYVDFSNLHVWLSILAYGALIVLLFKFLKSRHVLAFAIAFYLLNWVLISNLFFNIGATMGERLIFHSSVGFTIAIACLLYQGYEKINIAYRKQVGIAAIVIIVALCGFKTITRNADWQDNIALYTKDINTSPNSTAMNANVGTNYAMLSEASDDPETKNALIRQAVIYWSKAIAIYPHHVSSYVNRASAYIRFSQFDSAKRDLDTAKKYNPTFPTLHRMYIACYLKSALKNYNNEHNYIAAITDLETGLKEDPNNATMWYYEGCSYANLHQYDKSLQALGNAKKLSPNDAPLDKMIDSVKHLSGNNN